MMNPTLHSSFILLHLRLPTGLPQTRYLAGERQLAKHDAADLELAKHCLTAAGELTAVVTARRAAVARQVRQRGIVLLLLQLPSRVGELLHQRFATFLFRYPGFGCHLLSVTSFSFLPRGTEIQTASAARDLLPACARW